MNKTVEEESERERASETTKKLHFVSRNNVLLNNGESANYMYSEH